MINMIKHFMFLLKKNFNVSVLYIIYESKYKNKKIYLYIDIYLYIYIKIFKRSYVILGIRLDLES